MKLLFAVTFFLTGVVFAAPAMVSIFHRYLLHRIRANTMQSSEAKVAAKAAAVRDWLLIQARSITSSSISTNCKQTDDSFEPQPAVDILCWGGPGCRPR
jgi:hypothetical protein